LLQDVTSTKVMELPWPPVANKQQQRKTWSRMLATQLYNYKLLSVGLASNKALEVPHEMTEHTRSKQLPSALCPAKLQRRNGIQWIALRLLVELN
jgi:hypothetical protein